ncbi:MAG: FixH family protein [Emcibacteraceae bacterium]
MTTDIKPYTGKRILAWFLGFFIFVFAANGIMVYFALDTWTGLSTENSYVKGLNYNREIESARAQASSGWKVSITDQPELTEGRFEVTIERPQDSLPPADVTATFIRTVTEGYDQQVTLKNIGDGVYAAPIKLPLKGQWEILVVVKSQNNLIYKLEDRILVK